jgi:hypothetical protein
MKKLITLLILVGVAGGAVYGFVELRTEKRACRKLTRLCERGEQSADARESEKSCEESFAELKASSGPESIDKPAQCILESKTCAEAAGCFVGGVGSGLLRGLGGDFLKGLGKSLGSN